MNRLFAVLAGALLLAACSNEQPATAGGAGTRESAAEHAVKHLDPKYVCPMHPQIVRDKPGNCPICGMALVAVEAEPAATAVPAGERKILYYRHPHNPAITSERPMKDEMGMDYVPVHDDGGGGATVRISAAVEQNLGVRTAPAERAPLARRVDTVGYVDFDEKRIAHIHLRTQGWIQSLLVKSEGEVVNDGQLLFELYAPELVNAQSEYLQILTGGNDRLVAAAGERLLALGISPLQIETLRKTRKVEQLVRVYAPQGGIVARLGVREGMYVMPSVEIMTLADLSSVWLQAEIFERQAEWIEVGQRAEVRLSYLSGRVWEGVVEYVYPSLNPKTRTLRARLRFDNPDEALKPNMFAEVTIDAGVREDVVSVPREALIRTGKEQRVILALGNGRYQARRVEVGLQSGGRVEITRGLRAGEAVVTSGQFLIDSEASLKASLTRMGAEP